jgi:hypothetical protein
MSASNIHPNSLANLRPIPYKPGAEWKGNPGGNRKNTPHADAAYARLGSLSIEKLRVYEPANAVESAIKRSIVAASDAADWQEANAALKQLILCLDGSPLKRSVVEHTIDEGLKHEIIVEAYKLVFATKTKKQALAAIEAIYKAKDDQSRDLAIRAAIDADTEAIESVWEVAEKTVIGERVD